MAKSKIQTGKLERELEEVTIHEIASLVHGGLFVLHSLGIYYNLRKKRYLDAGIHGAIAIYDIIASYRHYKSRREND